MKTKDKCEPAIEQICFKIWAKVLYDKMNGPQKTFYLKPIKVKSLESPALMEKYKIHLCFYRSSNIPVSLIINDYNYNNR